MQEKAKPADKGPGFRQRLAEMTYLVSDRLMDPSLLETMRTYRHLIVAGGAMLGLFVAVVVRVLMIANPGPAAPAAPLAAVSVYGDVKTGTPPRPVVNDEDLKPKTSIKLGNASRVDLVTAHGGRVKVHSAMEIKIERVYDGDTSAEITITKGYCYANFAKRGEIVINYGKYSLKGNQVSFSMEEDQDGRYQVIVDAGRLQITTETGPQEIGQGDSLMLP